MAKKIRSQQVYVQIACAGRDGVRCDWVGMLRRWKMDGEPTELANVVQLLVRGGRLRSVMKSTGDGKQARFVVANT